MRFRCVSDVRRTGAGGIDVVEVRWNEPRAYMTEMWLGTAGVFMMLMAIVSFGGLSWRGLNQYDADLMWGGLAVTWGCVLASSFCWTFSVEMKGRARALAFSRDGTLRVPLGLATGRWANDRGYLPLADIVAAEPREERGTTLPWSGSNTWAVDLHCRTGHMVTVAERLSEEGAARLSVTLRAALNDLRGAPGGPPGAADRGA